MSDICSTLFIIWVCNKNDKEKNIEYILLIDPLKLMER